MKKKNAKGKILVKANDSWRGIQTTTLFYEGKGMSLNNLCAGGVMPVIIIAAVIGVLVFIYVKIMRRGKKCSCGAKYDSSCILEAKVLRTVKAAMGKDMSDVAVMMKCKQCGKVSRVEITVQGDQIDRYLDNEVKRHFDK